MALYSLTLLTAVNPVTLDISDTCQRCQLLNDHLLCGCEPCRYCI